MKSLKFYPTNINRRYIDETVSALRDGKLIIYPTDTLYAIGCDALNNRAIEKICRIKGINPAKQLLSIVCSDISQAAEYARIDNNAFRLMRSNLPGPFTFILPAATTLPKAFKGRHTVGVRIPDNDIARAIADALGISAETVKLHVSAIFRAYGVHSRTQLVLLCSRQAPAAWAPRSPEEASQEGRRESLA